MRISTYVYTKERDHIHAAIVKGVFAILYAHIKKQTGEKQNACKLTHMFTQRRDHIHAAIVKSVFAILYAHIKKHTGEKPYA